MKDFFEAVLETVAPILLILILVFFLACISVKCDRKEDKLKYNDGICTECGGHYIYEQAVSHMYDTDYIYICDKCGDMIELDSYRP